jgi:phenylalanyl-tRNA synthetase beta chain
VKVSYRWLRDLAPSLRDDVESVTERLAALGAPVEESVYLGAGLAGVVVARVEQVERHPGADRLSLCTVAAGGPTHLRVVCGAPNVQAGRLYPFAPVGTTLPGGVEIKKAKIRGEVSEGMLCSARELGMGSDHSGLLELAVDAAPGSPFVDVLGLDDWRLDVEVTSNRGDLLSHVGIAREVAPGGHADLALPEVPGAPPVEVALTSHPKEARVSGAVVRVEDAQLCPRYLGAVVRGVKVAPSPAWLQARLRAAGARPINNVVDATNYVLLELGQPLHAFDLGRLAESTVVVRRARASERTFRTLDGIERRITPDMLMICDATHPVAVAGVMGGEESEVTDGTTDVLLECALFHPPSIRATRKALGISTDASYRFERGVDPAGMERALTRALEVILATAGGKLERAVADCAPSTWTAAAVPLRIARIERVLGVPFTSRQVTGLLEPLGFDAQTTSPDEHGGEALSVRVPGFRSYDVKREIDLIEEVARRHGFDAFPAELGPYRPGSVPDHPLFALEDDLKRFLADRGLHEAQTPAFVPEGEGEVPLLNPMSREESFLRRRLLPSLLRRVEYNFARGERNVRLFEMGTSFKKGRNGGLPEEATHLTVALTGSRTPLHWSGDPGPFDLWDVKGLLEALLTRTGSRATLEPGAGEESALEPEESVVVRGPTGETLGWAGRVRAAAIDAPAWAAPVFGFELRLPADPGRPATPTVQALPAFPGVERDLALVVPDAVPAESVLSLLRRAGGDHLSSVRLFDLYRGKGVPEGTRSLAYRLHFQSLERTLTDSEVDGWVAEVARRLAEELNVRVRA